MRLHIYLLICVALLSACSSTSAPDEQAPSANKKEVNVDPFEPMNRVLWDFNYEVLDKFLLKPLTQTYIAVLPKVVRNRLYSASENLEEPAHMVNNLLQGKPSASAASLGRFLINSTFGFAGMFDVAEKMGLEKEEEDFGQVLGVWGTPTGPYLMLPARGPSTVRSLTGDVVDNFYWPRTILNNSYALASTLVSVLESRAFLLEQEEQLNRSLDPYLFVRDAYLQRLAFEVSDGKVKQKSEEEIKQEEEDFADFEAMFKD